MNINGKETRKLLDKISQINDIHKLVQYFQDNNLYDLLRDNDFKNQVELRNKYGKAAIEIYMEGKSIEEKTEEIERKIDEKGLRFVIEEGRDVDLIPKKYKEELFKLAQEFEEESQYEYAKTAYLKVYAFGKSGVDKFFGKYNKDKEAANTTYFKSRYNYYMCKIKNGEEITAKDYDELKKLAKEDYDNLLNLSQQGKIRSVDIFKKLCDNVTVEYFNNTILPSLSGGSERKKGERDVHPGPSGHTVYSEELSVYNRLKFIKDNYKLKSIMTGKERMDGFVIFEIEDSDILIAEKLWDGKKDKDTGSRGKGAATYFIHKDAEIDFEEASLGQLGEIKKQQNPESRKLIDKINHNKTYYD